MPTPPPKKEQPRHAQIPDHRRGSRRGTDGPGTGRQHRRRRDPECQPAVQPGRGDVLRRARQAGGSAQALAQQLSAGGATVTSINQAIGMVTVTSTDTAFASQTRGLNERLRRRTQPFDRLHARSRPPRPMWSSRRPSCPPASPRAAPAGKQGQARRPARQPAVGHGHDQCAGRTRDRAGDHRVTVGVLDTGIDGSHPDLKANFSMKLSRNFTTDMPDIDGPCEFAGCVDPANWDDNGHGTHVAGTIAAAAQRLRPQRRRARRHPGQHPGRPGQRLLLPGPGHQRAHLRRRCRHRRGEHVLLPRPVALQLRRRSAGGQPGRGGRPGRHHRGDDPRAELRQRPRRDAGRTRAGQRTPGHRQPAP